MSAARVLYLSAEAMTVQRWRHARLAEAFAFDADKQGLARFTQYVAATPHEPTLLLVDRVEEEFTVESMPHAAGRARVQLHARRAERLFRATPFRSALTLGRQSGGRRDDRVLVSALTQPDALLPWLQPLLDARVPLRAISSAAHVCAQLPRAVGLNEASLLLVTRHEEALRQTFFQGERLCLSRLSRPGAAAQNLLDEIARTRRYLQSSGFLQEGEELPVYLLGPEPLLADLGCLQSPERIRLRLGVVHEAASSIGLGECESLGAPALYGGLFQRAPKNRYAASAHLRGWRVYRAGMALELGAIIVALTLCLTAMTGTVAALEARRITIGLMAKLESHTAQLRRSTTEPLPDGLAPDQLRHSVESAERIATLPMGPGTALACLGAVLRSHPEIELRRIGWVASTTPGVGEGEESDSPAPWQAVAAPLRLYETLEVEGWIAVHGGTLRHAVDETERVITQLKAMPEVLEVNLSSAPVQPAMPLGLSVGREDPPPADRPLTLRVVFRP